MTDTPQIRPVVARLVPEPSLDRDPGPPGCRLFRPLVVGPAVMTRSSPRDRWLVRVHAGGRLVPRNTTGLPHRLRSLRASDTIHRVAAALVAPQDLAGPPPRLVPESRRPRSEFYGWALMYQLPGMRGVAAIDPHERFLELPTFYESPLELIDRSEFLGSRGIPSRPLALITQPADFAVAPNGRRCNRFYPGERFGRPVGLGWFA
jgi:hypothetical protein